MHVLLQYQSKSCYIIGQEVYYSIGRFYYIIGQLLQYRAFLLHYRAVITVSGVYYIIGWYTQCYLRYTGNLIRLVDGTKLLSPTPQRRHSTPKSFSARSNLTIFAPDGILCEKIETKCGYL